MDIREVIGSLGLLPPEIRRLIMEACLEQRCMTMLRLNSQLYNELAPLIQENFVFNITIDPSSPRTEVALFGANPVLLEVPCGSHIIKVPACLDGRRIPFHAFKGVDIDIPAPDPSDPAQLIRGFQQVTRLLDWLLPQWKRQYHPPTTEAEIECASHNIGFDLPHIKLTFLQTPQRVWGNTCDVAATTAPRQRSHFNPEIFDMCDLEIMLLPFQRIRHAEKMTIILPDDRRHPSLEELCFDVCTSAVCRTPFGLGGGPNDPVWETASIQQSLEDYCHLCLDYMLDHIPGPSANKLRLERFRNWSARWRKEMKHRRSGKNNGDMEENFGGAGRLLDTQTGLAIQLGQTCRWVHWSTFLPRAPFPQSRPAWETVYPDGIPALHSVEFQTSFMEAAVRKATYLAAVAEVDSSDDDV
ncbi:hypothetical protein LTS15_005564 [Exophiala xenobiotica]|nr:hypothetical protein LTS15_005564 [Exophiala xenobiotica]